VPGSSPSKSDVQRQAWRETALERFTQSIEAPTRFFELHADRLSLACLAMAKRFERGGRLLVFGNGSSATDAQHVSVEFVHPVIVGKRALPAIALSNDIASILGVTQSAGVDEIFAQQLRLLGASNDIALGLSLAASDRSVLAALREAKTQGILTIGLGGGTATAASDWDFEFTVPSNDPSGVERLRLTAKDAIPVARPMKGRLM